MKHDFYLGAATAAYQVEGNNIYSDIWQLERMKYSGYRELSKEAANHFFTYKQDILKMKEAGLNAYRFSLEWSRIEPEEGCFCQEALAHYEEMIRFCRSNGIEPIVTLFHFSSPKWLIEKGGWEAQSTETYYLRYVKKVCERYHDLLSYVITFNEANIGIMIAKYMKLDSIGDSLQVGIDPKTLSLQDQEKEEENLRVFKCKEPAVFVAPRSEKGIELLMEIHKKAVRMIHEMIPDAKAGLSLSLRDLQYLDDQGKKEADKAWEEEFLQFLPSIAEDDFFGLQNYTRAVFDQSGEVIIKDQYPPTQMGYEYYPWALENTIRKVHDSFRKEILVTENGIATADDLQRIRFIDEALKGVQSCIKDGIDVGAYLHWSLIDNYEWQSGYSMHFGLMCRDEDHTPKHSLKHLGSWCSKL